MKNENLYLNIINNLNDGVYFVDFERKITFWNKAAEAITGYSAEEIRGLKCGETLLNHIDMEGRPLCTVSCPLYATLTDGMQRKADVLVRHKEGHRIPIQVNIFPMYEDSKIIGAVEIFTRCTQTVYADNWVKQLSGMAMYDQLTGLPNRSYLQTFLEYKLTECKRFNTPYAVLFLDIDHFRHFNNTYGHEVGDIVLKTMSQTILQNTRESDLFGRWGGEEFVGIYDIKDAAKLPAIGEKLRMLVANSEIPHTPPLSVTASIGITQLCPDDTLTTVLERADKLMYESKAKGRNCVTTD